jgi:DNA-binding CsgD family transcriptional regulator
MDKVELALKHLRSPYWFVEDLTEKEREAVRLASFGFSIPDVVASRMKLSPKHTYRLLHKATEKISRQYGKKVTFQELPSLLLKKIEEVLSDERE